MNVKLWLPHQCSVLKYFFYDFEVYQEKNKDRNMVWIFKFAWCLGGNSWLMKVNSSMSNNLLELQVASCQMSFHWNTCPFLKIFSFVVLLIWGERMMLSFSSLKLVLTPKFGVCLGIIKGINPCNLPRTWNPHFW